MSKKNIRTCSFCGRPMPEMFSGDKNIKTIEELVAEIKNYFELQKKYVGLECVSKLVILLSALILGMIMFLIGAVAFILIAFCMASLVGDLTGSLTLGYASVAAFFVVLAIVVYVNRSRWITTPIVNFLGNLFLSGNND